MKNKLFAMRLFVAIATFAFIVIGSVNSVQAATTVSTFMDGFPGMGIKQSSATTTLIRFQATTSDSGVSVTAVNANFSGTGFATIKAIIEHVLHVGLKRPMHFYWGARKLADLYMLESARQWESSGIKFTPVLSEPLPGDNWHGRTGMVHQAVLDDFRDLSGFEVYACGAPVMVAAAHRDYTALRGLPEDAFFSDMFTFTPKG